MTVHGGNPPTELPDELFHYTTLDGAKAILSGLTLKFTPPNQLNDPFEFMPQGYEDVRPSVIKRQLKDKYFQRNRYRELVAQGGFRGSFSDFKKELCTKEARHEQVGAVVTGLGTRDFQGLQDRVSSQLGIACFSATATSILMWAHYAKNDRGLSHHGVVVGFSTKMLSIGSGRWVEMSYSDDRVLVPFAKAQGDPLFQTRVTEIFSRKAACWSYEQEWRAVAQLADLKRVNNAYLLPLEQGCITRVILGARADSVERGDIATVVRKLNPAVPIQLVKLHPRRFALEFA